MDQWLIYGANGYTGALLAEEAVKRGHQPLLGGRSLAKLGPIAAQLGLEAIAFDLGDAVRSLDDHQVKLVLHAAGPFIYTSSPMLEACLQVGSHYLDLTGELPVFENTFAHDRAARDKGVVLMSGAGFDIVPSDCLIKYVAEQVDDPQSVELVIGGPTLSKGAIGASAGTLKTNLEMMAIGFVVRRNGRLVPVHVGAGLKQVRLLDGEHTALIVPWGDVVTAYHSTGIPNITAYMTFPPEQARAMSLAGFLLQRLLEIKAVRHQAARLIEHYVSGPSEQMRQTGRTQLYAEVIGKDGQRAEAWLETREAYQFTVLAAINATERILAGTLSGALTPAQAFGADFVLEVAGTLRQDTLSRRV